VEVSECLGTNVSSGVKKQKTSVGLRAKHSKADNKTAGKEIVRFDCKGQYYLAIFILPVDSSTFLYLAKNTLRDGHQQPFSLLSPTRKNITGSYTFYVDALGQLRGSGPHSSCSSYAAA